MRDVAGRRRRTRGGPAEERGGAHATFELGPAATLDLGGDTIVALTSKQSLELIQGRSRCANSGGREGSAVTSHGGGSHRRDRFYAGGHAAVRARSPERAVVTVEKGKVTLRSGAGEALVVFPGETVEWVKGRPPQRSASFVATEPHHATGRPVVIAEQEPRGAGAHDGAPSGANRGGLRRALASHKVDVVVRDGIARTYVEEVFQNDTAQVLEGRYVFPPYRRDHLGSGAVGERSPGAWRDCREEAGRCDLQGDRRRHREAARPCASRVGRGGRLLAQDFPTPRQGDAQGSHWLRLGAQRVGGEDSLRLPPVSGSRASHHHRVRGALRPPIHGRRSAKNLFETPHYATAKTGEPGGFQLNFVADHFTPSNDFVGLVRARRSRERRRSIGLRAVVGRIQGKGARRGRQGGRGRRIFLLPYACRFPVGLSPAYVRHDRAIVIDTSHSQSQETLKGEFELATGLLARMNRDEHFVVLACDSACITFPNGARRGVRRAALRAQPMAPGASSDGFFRYRRRSARCRAKTLVRRLRAGGLPRRRFAHLG